ncbi:hypothetical protein [Campylobacter concisus]|nr:hypothetical protein [Campylobacter concisus]
MFGYSHSKIYKIKRAKFREDEMSVVSAPSKMCKSTTKPCQQSA